MKRTLNALWFMFMGIISGQVLIKCNFSIGCILFLCAGAKIFIDALKE